MKERGGIDKTEKDSKNDRDRKGELLRGIQIAAPPNLVHHGVSTCCKS